MGPGAFPEPISGEAIVVQTRFVGQRVKVTSLTDETACAEALGQIGKIVYLDYDCGCGQTYPDDPMVGVQLDSAVREFWSEELTVIT